MILPAPTASWVPTPNRRPEVLSPRRRAGAGSVKMWKSVTCPKYTQDCCVSFFWSSSISSHFAVTVEICRDHGSEVISESVGSTHVLQTLTRKPLLHVAQTRLIERITLGEKCKNIGHVRILTKRMAKSEYAGLHRNIQHRNIDWSPMSIYILICYSFVCNTT